MSGIIECIELIYAVFVLIPRWTSTWDWGNVADWFGAIGTILAIMVSVWITRYQIKNDQKLAKENFFNEQEFIMLNHVAKKIDDARQTTQKISIIVNKNNDKWSKKNTKSSKKIKSNVAVIHKLINKINKILYEYGRTRDGYTEINMYGMHNLLGAWSSVNKELIKRHGSTSTDDINAKISKFLQILGYIEETIIQKKKDVRH